MFKARAHAHACAQTQVEERLSLRVEELEVFKQVPACCAAVQTAPPKRKKCSLVLGRQRQGLACAQAGVQIGAGRQCRNGSAGKCFRASACVRACVQAATELLEEQENHIDDLVKQVSLCVDMCTGVYMAAKS